MTTKTSDHDSQSAIEIHERLKEYVIALEHSRADLWGANEELRNKIVSLEKGMEDLLELQKDVKFLEDALIGVSVFSEDALFILEKTRSKRVAPPVGVEPILE